MSEAYVIVGGVDPTSARRSSPPKTRARSSPIATRPPPQGRRRAQGVPRRRRRRRPGLLYLPGSSGHKRRPRHSATVADVTGWEWDRPTKGAAGAGRAVVPFPNRADMHGRRARRVRAAPPDPRPDQLHDPQPARDRHAAGVPQRAIKGVPDKDADGNEIDYDDIFSADPGAMWLLPHRGAVGVRRRRPRPDPLAIRDDVQDLAAVTRTPLFYLTPDSANGSAEGASLAREGLVFKTSGPDRADERVVGAGDVARVPVRRRRDPGPPADMEVLWAPPDRCRWPRSTTPPRRRRPRTCRGGRS
jgi:hypothetical protein